MWQAMNVCSFVVVIIMIMINMSNVELVLEKGGK